MAQGVCNDMQFTDVTASAGINHVFVWPPTSNASTVGGATAVDVNGESVHTTGPAIWKARIAEQLVRVQ